MLVWTNVPRTNVAWTNVPMTYGIWQRWPPIRGWIFYENQGNFSQRLQTNSSPKVTRKPHNQHNNLHISIKFSTNFKNICQHEETLPQNTKKGKPFPNILFVNNVKYSPLPRKLLIMFGPNWFSTSWDIADCCLDKFCQDKCHCNWWHPFKMVP